MNRSTGTSALGGTNVVVTTTMRPDREWAGAPHLRAPIAIILRALHGLAGATGPWCFNAYQPLPQVTLAFTAAADYRCQLFAVGDVEFGAGVVEMSLHGAH